MRPVASFIFRNTSQESKKICLIPGHYNTSEIVYNETVSSGPTPSLLSMASPKSIKNAGYDCDQVADDFNGASYYSSKYPIQITPKSAKTSYRDFLNYIKLSGVRISKMRITDLTAGANPSHDIFYQEMEISKSAIGSKSGSDFIQLASHINPANYLQNFIEVDLEKQNLLLDETTLAFLDVPASAHFQIDFTLAE